MSVKKGAMAATAVPDARRRSLLASSTGFSLGGLIWMKPVTDEQYLAGPLIRE